MPCNPHRGKRIAAAVDADDAGVVEKPHASFRTALRKRLRELMRVAGFVARRHAVADDAVAALCEGRFDLHAFVGGFHVELASEFAHQARGRLGGLEFRVAGLAPVHRG